MAAPRRAGSEQEAAGRGGAALAEANADAGAEASIAARAAELVASGRRAIWKQCASPTRALRIEQWQVEEWTAEHARDRLAGARDGPPPDCAAAPPPEIERRRALPSRASVLGLLVPPKPGRR